MDKMSKQQKRHLKKLMIGAWIIVANLSLFYIHATDLSTLYPKGNKSAEDKIHLIHADNLEYDQFTNPDAQRLSGDVEFLHKDLRMFCDSAVLFLSTNSFEAFGSIKIEQGDTVSLLGEYLYYDGNTQIAEVRYNVEMRHRESLLLTDSLNFDRLESKGYFFEGGTLIDGENVLTSDWGEYYTSTRKSSFNYNVILESPQYRLISDTLNYDLQTKWADVSGPSEIRSGKSIIKTQKGYYNTETQKAELFERSQYYNGGKSVVGDSVYYDKLNGIATAYNNIIYEDTISKHILLGDYCYYNEILGDAIVTKNALAKEYSSSTDTLFVHADTLKLHTYNIDTDSLYRTIHGYYHVRAYRDDIQAVCDSLSFNSQDKRMTMYKDPIVWSEARQILGEEINVFLNDSTIDSIYVERQALLVEQVDSLHYNQVSGQEMHSYFKNGEMRENQVVGNVQIIFYPLENDSTVLYHNYTETSKMSMFMQNRKLHKIWAPASQGYFYPIGTAPRERTILENFAWFDYIRPKNKYDLFEWRGKEKGKELKATIRREAPLQKLK
jgi:lipopolysaccharide assembly outer membrane protein LptD (OstA)